MSIDSATSAVSVAMSATNSTGPSAVDFAWFTRLILAWMAGLKACTTSESKTF